MHIIDIKGLSEMFFGDMTKVKIVTDTLIARIPEWQAEASACATANNHEKTRELCHRIRGAAASIRAEKLTEAVTNLGEFVKNGQVDKIKIGFKDLNRCLEEIRTISLDLPSEDTIPH